MKRRCVAVAALGVVFGLLGCSDDSSTDIADHTWEVSYSVRNNSSQLLRVELSGPSVGSGVRTVEVAAGATAALLNYSAFLAPPPDAGRDFWCISIRSAAGGRLVHQLCPVSNSQWLRNDPQQFTAEFILVVNQEDIGEIDDQCPRLEGVVIEKGSGDPIESATVYYEYGQGSFGLTNAEGEYWLHGPSGMPAARIVVFKEGYLGQEFAAPDSLEQVGGGLYLLDVELVRVGR